MGFGGREESVSKTTVFGTRYLFVRLLRIRASQRLRGIKIYTDTLLYRAKPQAAHRTGGLTHRSRGVHARPRRRDRSARPGEGGPGGTSAERPHARRSPGQHHALLADAH